MCLLTGIYSVNGFSQAIIRYKFLIFFYSPFSSSVNPITDKEIEIAIKLAGTYQEYLQDHQSPEYRELSGNIEQAVSFLSQSHFYVLLFKVLFSGTDWITGSLLIGYFGNKLALYWHYNATNQKWTNNPIYANPRKSPRLYYKSFFSSFFGVETVYRVDKWPEKWSAPLRFFCSIYWISSMFIIETQFTVKFPCTVYSDQRHLKG